MKYFNVCTKQTYTDKSGTQKNKWFNVGTYKETDDGKRFLELNMFPNTSFYIFEPKKKEESSTDKWDN